jgi:hypothetical protein
MPNEWTTNHDEWTKNHNEWTTHQIFLEKPNLEKDCAFSLKEKTFLFDGRFSI